MVDDRRQNRLDFGDAHSAAEQGLKVVTAQFKEVEPFSWNLFDGFERMRVLTYSASAPMIVKMLDRHSFEFFECVFGYEGGPAQGRRNCCVSAVSGQPGDGLCSAVER